LERLLNHFSSLSVLLSVRR